MDITQLLAFCHESDASDLHLSAGSPPVLRIYGGLKRVKTEALSSEEIKKIIYPVMSEHHQKQFEQEKELDFAVTYAKDTRFRVNLFRNRGGISAVFRLIPNKIPSFAELDLPPIFEKLSSLPKGLVLLTGPSGSGKSTTLAAMVNYINDHFNKHIITIEDPVEFIHQSNKSLINHREIGHDTHSYAQALKGALRQDPNVILVGEMRDYETISLALTAAETGHLVFSTLHAASPENAISRIIDVFPAQDKEMVRTMLANSLEGIVSQILIKRKDGKGRISAFETLIGNLAIKNMIKENRLSHIRSVIETGSKHGMMTMQNSVQSLIDHGLVVEEDVASSMLDLNLSLDRAAQ